MIEEEKKNTVSEITKIRNELKRDNAVLSLQCQKINFWTNLVQINAIFFSTTVSFIETVKSIYDIKSNTLTVISILITSYIGVSLSIVKFMKLTDRLEELVKLSERFSFAIRKLRKIQKNIEVSSEYTFKSNIALYENEIYDYYIETREIFDNAITFKELVYLKKNFLKTFSEYKCIQNKINKVGEKESLNMTIVEIPWWKNLYKKYICCSKSFIKEEV